MIAGGHWVVSSGCRASELWGAKVSIARPGEAAVMYCNVRRLVGFSAGALLKGTSSTANAKLGVYRMLKLKMNHNKNLMADLQECNFARPKPLMKGTPKYEPITRVINAVQSVIIHYTSVSEDIRH